MKSAIFARGGKSAGTRFAIHRVILVLAAMLLAASLFVRPETAFGASQVSTDIRFSSSASCVQISFVLNRVISPDGLKGKKTAPLTCHSIQAAGQPISPEHHSSMHLLGTSCTIHGGNVQQALLLLDLPPPQPSFSL